VNGDGGNVVDDDGWSEREEKLRKKLTKLPLIFI